MASPYSSDTYRVSQTPDALTRALIGEKYSQVGLHTTTKCHAYSGLDIRLFDLL
jgi:hypothetical protein